MLRLAIIDDDYDFAVTRSPRQKTSTESSFTDLVKNLGSRPGANVEVRGFQPFVSDLKIDAGEGAAVVVDPEDIGYLYSVVFADFPAGAEREIRYRLGGDAREPSFSVERARVVVEGRTVALSATPALAASDSVRAAGLRAMAPAPAARIAGRIKPIECSPDSCTTCPGMRLCNRQSPHCQWVSERNVCLPSCGALGGSCQSSAGGTRICLQDKGESWDCELCCADPTTTISCLRPEPWGSSGGARFLDDYNPDQCQPGNPCDMGIIDAGGCWLKLQACWALQDWQNVTGKSMWAFSQDDHVLAVLRYVEQYMGYRVDEENEDCLCPRTGWCFGSPRLKRCEDYWVSWPWFWDWMCDYPVMAKQVSETGELARDGACAYCVGRDYCGDCEDFAHLRAGLLRSNGFHSDCIWVAHGPNHAFNHCLFGGAFRICDYGPQPRFFSTSGAHEADGVFNDRHGGFFSDPHSGTQDPRDFTWNYPRFFHGAAQDKTCTVPFHGRDAYRADYCP